METSVLAALGESTGIYEDCELANTGFINNSIASMEKIGSLTSNKTTEHLDSSANSKICEPVKIHGFTVELVDPGLLRVTTNHNLPADKVLLQTKSHPMALDEEQDIWEVEKLLGKRRRGQHIQYLVKWKGFPDEDNTWEPTKNIFDKHLIYSFNSSRT